DRSANPVGQVQSSCAGHKRSRPSGSRDPPARRTRSVSPQIRLVPGARDMRLGESDAYRLELAATAAELAGARIFGQLLENILCEKFGSGVAAFEFRYFVEIAIVQRGDNGLERLMLAA